MTSEPQKKMISIWTWVGLVLGVYGAIITAMGLYYVASPETLTVTAKYNPSLWWGLLMLVSGVAFSIGGRLSQRKA
jgi:CDP-diglyceride synthetase